MLVAGFQGVSTADDVTTLGRGGSDTTAVAVAAALGADECEIYTDVTGVFSADPRIVPEARKLPIVSFEEMLEMASSGAGVLQLRSVEYARNHAVRIHCRSSFDDRPGTVVLLRRREHDHAERPLITAVTHSTSEAMVTLIGVSHELGVAARIFETLARGQRERGHDRPERAPSTGGRAEISFTVPARRPEMATGALEAMTGSVFEDMATQREMGKVSIVGAGMRSHPGVAAKVFTRARGEGINIEMISTSPIKISCVIARDRVEQAVQALHSAFELSGRGTLAGGAAVRGARSAVVGADGRARLAGSCRDPAPHRPFQTSPAWTTPPPPPLWLDAADTLVCRSYAPRWRPRRWRSWARGPPARPDAATILL